MEDTELLAELLLFAKAGVYDQSQREVTLRRDGNGWLVSLESKVAGLPPTHAVRRGATFSEAAQAALSVPPTPQDPVPPEG